MEYYPKSTMIAGAFNKPSLLMEAANEREMKGEKAITIEKNMENTYTKTSDNSKF